MKKESNKNPYGIYISKSRKLCCKHISINDNENITNAYNTEIILFSCILCLRDATEDV